MTKLNVRRIGISSFAKLVGVWAAILGLVMGVMAGVVGVASFLSTNNFGVILGIVYSLLIVVAALVIYPLVMFVFGWIQGAIIALIFNIVISGSGGLEVDVDEEVVSKK